MCIKMKELLHLYKQAYDMLSHCGVIIHNCSYNMSYYCCVLVIGEVSMDLFFKDPRMDTK